MGNIAVCTKCKRELYLSDMDKAKNQTMGGSLFVFCGQECLAEWNKKPSNSKELTAILETFSISERTGVLNALVNRGYAKDEKEADELMNACGFHIWATSEDGWEPFG